MLQIVYGYSLGGPLQILFKLGYYPYFHGIMGNLVQYLANS